MGDDVNAPQQEEKEFTVHGGKRVKKMLSWSTSSGTDDEGNEAKEPLPVVHSPQKLSRNVPKNKITAAYLREHCRDNDLYMTPHLNTVLYLHHKGFKKIENLEAYTGLKTIWLENNSIKVIENLRYRMSSLAYIAHTNKSINV